MSDRTTTRRAAPPEPSVRSEAAWLRSHLANAKSAPTTDRIQDAVDAFCAVVREVRNSAEILRMLLETAPDTVSDDELDMATRQLAWLHHVSDELVTRFGDNGLPDPQLTYKAAARTVANRLLGIEELAEAIHVVRSARATAA